MAAVFVAATGLVCAQGAPAVQPANPASPQPAAPAAAHRAPAAEAYTYDPAGRRDPFVSLLSRGMETAAGKKLTGLAGLTTGEVMLRGSHTEPQYVRRVGVRTGRQNVFGTCERSPSRRRHPKCDAAGHRHHAGRQRSPLAGETARSAKRTQDSGRWQITQSTCVRPNGRRVTAAPGRIMGCGPDAAGRVWPASSETNRPRRHRG